MTNHPAKVDLEVEWGESQEGKIARRWQKLSPLAKLATRVIKSDPYDDFDFYVFRKNGFPLVWLEVKGRRKPFSAFGDVIVPLRKHDFARDIWEAHHIPAFVVTEYACGTLVQVDLRQKPNKIQNISRKDRPKDKSVPHAIYEKTQILALSDATV